MLLPELSTRALFVWRRNFLVWRKMAITTLLGNLADPMIYLFGLGYGLGNMLPAVGGAPYFVFLSAGVVCSSTMFSATFEATYSAFSRLQQQKTWEAIIHAPLSLDDVVAGELLWAASKATLSGSIILAVVSALGLVSSPLALWVAPTLFLSALAFAALGLVFTALAPAYDFFMYWFTLVITPMTLLSGVYFPFERLPQGVQLAAQILPLAHAVELIRPLMLGRIPAFAWAHLLALLVTAALAFFAAVVLARRRLLN